MKNTFFKKNKLLMFLGFSLCIAPLTSCSAFFGGDEFTITDTSVTTDAETGDTIVTITFSGSDREPLTFRIPTVKNGSDGVGISDITSELHDGMVTLTIEYTDASIEPTKISIPVQKGEAGKGISNVIIGETESGDKTLHFIYTDGTESELITIPKGLDGKNGLGIASITNEPNDNGNITVTIYFDDPSIPPQNFEVTNGVSILSVVYNEEMSDDDNYALNVIFSNGSQTTIYLPRPTSTRWYSGFSEPSDDVGNQGDFYVNLNNGNTYYKLNDSTWEFVFCMKGDDSSTTTKYYQVKFNLGEDEFSGDYGPNSSIIFNVQENDYLELENIPIPTKSGFTFEGWYTSSLNNVNSGQFTDTTLVNKNFDLYTRWSALNE